MYIHLSPDLSVTPGELHLRSIDLPVMITVLEDDVMEENETATVTLKEINFSQEQGKYIIDTLNIIIAADECESSRAYIHNTQLKHNTVSYVHFMFTSSMTCGYQFCHK